jgi:hypothetical protein
MGIAPRGPRFAALITTVVLAVVLVTGSVWLLATQPAVFAMGAVLGFCLGCQMYVLIRRIWPGRPVLVLADADKEA